MEVINNVVQFVEESINGFIEFTHNDADAFIVILMVILGALVLVSLLMLLNELDKWIRGERHEFKQRRY
jgi:hypothetical protein